MLHIEQVNKKFGQEWAVCNLSLQVAKGETLVLLGTSGSGKTTTLKMINRLIEPDSGEIFLNGQNVLHQNLQSLRRNIGYVIQNVGLFPHYTVAENIGIVPQLLGWHKTQIQARTAELTQLMRLPKEFLTKKPAQLSGGQQQRVGIARALAANPPLLLMDEPFGALDPITRNQIRAEFKQWSVTSDTTKIIVTHDIQEAALLADKVCLMDKGKIQQIGTMKSLLYAPENDFVSRFFAEQKLELLWKITTLEAVITQIEFNEDQTDDTLPSAEVLVLSAKMTVFECMQLIKEKEPALIKIVDAEGIEIQKISLNVLLESFFITPEPIASSR